MGSAKDPGGGYDRRMSRGAWLVPGVSLEILARERAVKLEGRRRKVRGGQGQRWAGVCGKGANKPGAWGLGPSELRFKEMLRLA
jgi:hypothetical protein